MEAGPSNGQLRFGSTVGSSYWGALLLVRGGPDPAEDSPPLGPTGAEQWPPTPTDAWSRATGQVGLLDAGRSGLQFVAVQPRLYLVRTQGLGPSEWTKQSHSGAVQSGCSLLACFDSLSAALVHF